MIKAFDFMKVFINFWLNLTWRERLIYIFSVIPVVIGITVIFGWIIGSHNLKSVMPNFVVMKFNTAVGLCLFGIALLTLKISFVHKICLYLICCIAGLTLFEYIIEVNMIDELIFQDSGTYPGRMSPITAVIFIFLSISLFLLYKYPIIAQVLTVIVFTISLLACIGYLYGVEYFYSYSANRFANMALLTAIAFFVGSLGVLFLSPDYGIVDIIFGDNVGVIMVSHMVPVAIFVPILLASLRLFGQKVGLFDARFGIALNTILFIATFVGFIFWSAISLRGLDKTNKDLENFALIAAHDLQDPMKQNSVFLKLIKEGKAEYLQEIEKNNLRMQDFVKSLLVFARSGGSTLKLAIVPIKSIIDNVLEDLNLRVNESEAKIIIGEMPTISCDPVQIRMVFQNLLQNAMRYRSPERSLVIKINAVLKSYWEFSVSDNGLGIAPNRIKDLFLIYKNKRIDSTGAGFGLATCKRIVDAHHGSIRVESEEGKGSCFSFIIKTN